MNEKYFPIGTVVLLKNGTKRVMITGFATVEKQNPGKIYDYCGCVYPEGQVSFNEICVFDHNQIEKVFFIGFSDNEERSFKTKLISELKKRQ